MPRITGVLQKQPSHEGMFYYYIYTIIEEAEPQRHSLDRACYFYTKAFKTKYCPLHITKPNFSTTPFSFSNSTFKKLKYILQFYMYIHKWKALFWRYLYSHIHCSIVHNRQIAEFPKCLVTGEWIMKMKYKKKSVEYYWLLKRNNPC